MPTDAFPQQIAELRELGGQRVWSLMVSLFGDLAQKPGKAIEGPILSAMMRLLSVKPEATRVALHRLRNDGWISSEKAGRISRHSLTEKGLRESAAASPRIYASPGEGPESWRLAFLPEGAESAEEMRQRGFTPVTARVYVGPPEAAAPADALLFEGKDVPDWLRAEAAPSELSAAFADLADTLERLAADLPAADKLSPVQVAVLRCLIVHNWRRLVLKHPPLPAPLVSHDWPGHRCHLLVADLLARYPRPPLERITLSKAA